MNNVAQAVSWRAQNRLRYKTKRRRALTLRLTSFLFNRYYIDPASAGDWLVIW
jgi:hypothetical protein